MRKWMSERLKRRKKNTEESASGPKPAPLQPAYFDADAPAPTAPAEVYDDSHDAVAAAPPAEVDGQLQVLGRADRNQAQTPDPNRGRGDATRPKRRRGRGGRGRRGGRGPASPAEVQAPSAQEAVPQTRPRISPVAPQSAAAPKGIVVLAVGLPGSGKSSWFKRHNITPLSSDLLRALLFDDVKEQRFQDLVFSNLRSMLKARLVARRPLSYVDTTNLAPHERQSWIKLAKDFGYEVHAVFFDVPVEVCLERNQKRDRVVPEDVMRRMAGKLKPPTFEEGFTKITVVRVKQKEA